MDKLRRALSGDEEEEDESGFSRVMDQSTLSWGTRVKGFIACFVLGIILSVIGSICLFFGNVVAFGIVYTLGNLIAMASTCFLCGPVAQIKKMFAKTRILATVLVFTFMVLTLLAGLALHKAGLALLFCILQFLAMTWYSISYIPFARDAIKKVAGSCLA